jgi:hypothetical protein
MANVTLNRDEKKAIAGRVFEFEKLSTWRLVDVHCRFANRLETALSPYSRESLVMQSSVIATILAGRGVPEPEIATICPTCDVETEGPGCEWCGWGDTHEMNDYDYSLESA